MPSGHYNRKPIKVTVSEVRALAEVGARARVKELRAELARLLSTFPALAGPDVGDNGAPVDEPLDEPRSPARERHARKMAKTMKARWAMARAAEAAQMPTRPTRKISAATRRALREGAKKYWAKKRAEKAAADSPE